jgi:type IV secretion system protein VirD4
VSIRDVAEQGVSKLRTRRQRRIRTTAAVLALVGFAVGIVLAAAAVTLVRDGHVTWPQLQFRPPRVQGAGPLFDAKDANASRKGWQFPAVLSMPAPWVLCLPIGGVLGLVWFRLLVAPLFARTRRETRHQSGLARLPKIRQQFGARTVRRRGKFTLPTIGQARRLTLPMTSFGYQIGRPVTPHGRRRLWADFEQRVRIIARQGWGKTLRLLVPIVRSLPGPAVISSIEAEIFLSTVTARQYRRRPTRYPILRLLLPSYRAVHTYPVFVVDHTSVQTRIAAGYPQVRWNPIPGCQDPIVATNRARALVHAGDKEAGTDSGTDKFFRDAATDVLSAWLHAAALSGQVEISDLVGWLRDSDVATPKSLLIAAGDRADGGAIINLVKHLDPKAGRTTSGVERYLTFALKSLASKQGRATCGSTRDPQFSFETLIEREGTVYLLAEPDRVENARPLLSLIAQEMFLAAERVARRQPGRTKRLPNTFMGVLDELKYGVRVANLPYVAGGMRKFGISYVYACQTATQEEQLYGPNDARVLRDLADTSIIGGIDPASAKDIADRAGQTAVVRASRGLQPGQGSEQLQMLDVLPISDQQELQNGQAVVLGAGLKPFIIYTKSIYERGRRYRHRITQESDQVNQVVGRARNQLISDDRYEQMMGPAATGGGFSKINAAAG